MKQATKVQSPPVPRAPGRDDAVPDDRAKQDAALDEALKQTFPASDPIAV
jgi:hypothetical protein